MNILLIVSDTFRRDNLAVYGGNPTVTSELNRFASDSLVFNHFYATSFPTVPARADLHTARITFPNQGWGPLRSDWKTLAELAAEAGYHTMEVTDVPFLVRNGFGYDRGFHDYLWIRGQLDQSQPRAYADVSPGWREEADHFAARTMLEASRWLERHVELRGASPFLLVADTWDPHEPWDPPAHYLQRHGNQIDYSISRVPYPTYQLVSESGLREGELLQATAAYRAKANMVDFWIGHLLRRLEILGLADSTAVMFLTDHGFYFGEHGYFGKSHWLDKRAAPGGPIAQQVGHSPLYEEVAHIPLLLRIPGVSGRRVDGMAMMPDVTATILKLMGASIPDNVQGKSLVDLVRPEVLTLSREFAVSSWPLHVPGDITQAVDSLPRRFQGCMPITVSTEQWSLLYTSSSDPVELYNLETDPRQEQNIALDFPEIVQTLHASLIECLEDAKCPDKYLDVRRTVQV